MSSASCRPPAFGLLLSISSCRPHLTGRQGEGQARESFGTKHPGVSGEPDLTACIVASSIPRPLWRGFLNTALAGVAGLAQPLLAGEPAESPPALSPVEAAPTAAPAWDFGTSISRLSSPHRSAGSGLDLNLVYSHGDTELSLGWFHSARLELTQWRASWDDRFKLGQVALIPSLQVASGGFVGGSVAAEIGQRWFGGVGLGRTNLREYASLNFDPNDAWFIYGGFNDEGRQRFELQWVRDNRDNPDQQHVHLVWLREGGNGQQLTIDLLFKQGTVEGRFVRRTGLMLRHDWPRWYVSLAWDPLVNFTPQDMARLQIGWRF